MSWLYAFAPVHCCCTRSPTAPATYHGSYHYTHHTHTPAAHYLFTPVGFCALRVRGAAERILPHLPTTCATCTPSALPPAPPAHSPSGTKKKKERSHGWLTNKLTGNTHASSHTHYRVIILPGHGAGKSNCLYRLQFHAQAIKTGSTTRSDQTYAGRQAAHAAAAAPALHLHTALQQQQARAMDLLCLPPPKPPAVLPLVDATGYHCYA